MKKVKHNTTQHNVRWWRHKSQVNRINVIQSSKKQIVSAHYIWSPKRQKLHFKKLLVWRVLFEGSFPMSFVFDGWPGGQCRGDVNRGQRSWGGVELEMTESSIWAGESGGVANGGFTFSSKIEFDDGGHMVMDWGWVLLFSGLGLSCYFEVSDSLMLVNFCFQSFFK